jgi:hypothetical protein
MAKKHVKPLKEESSNTEINESVEDCASVVILPQCQDRTVYTPECIGCKHECVTSERYFVKCGQFVK